MPDVLSVDGPKGPLAGKRVVVTRAADQAGVFSDMLRAAGAEVVELPTIRTVPPDDYTGLDGAIAGLGGFDYIIFTSVNALEFFSRRLTELGLGLDGLLGARIIAVGPKTAAALAGRGLKPDIVPEEYKAEGVLAALEGEGVKGRRFLYPRAEAAREVLPERLREMGAEVVVATAYRTVAPEADPGRIREIFDAGVSAITFTSSSTVKNFAAMAGGDARGYLKGVCVACIGPVTARTCEEMGIEVAVMPREYTVDALVSSLTEYFKRR